MFLIFFIGFCYIINLLKIAFVCLLQPEIVFYYNCFKLVENR